MSREERGGRRVSAARRRAETHVSGFETTVLRMPDGVGFFEWKAGTHLISIIPYTVKHGKEVRGGNPMAEKGELYFERTFYTYRKIGVDEKDYICMSKTFAERDYIAGWKEQAAKKATADKETLDGLKPKERQIFLVFDHKNPDKGLQVLESSFHSFGKLLDSRVRNSSEDEGWDLFYFPDADGMMLRVTVEEDSTRGYKWSKATAIDFLKRKEPLPAEVVNHGIDLDEMLVRNTYEQLKAVFLGTDEGGTGEADSKPATRNEQPKEDPPKKDEPPKKEEAPFEEPAKKEEPKKPSAASQVGISEGSYVGYQGAKCRVMKISPDGTSLVLMRESDDEIFKPVGCDEVSLPKAKPTPEPEPAKAPPPKQEEPTKKEEAKAAPASGDKWDDWD